ncbi:unnamed protein product [Gongylonema pulchrum]|uniref:Uncharacterized protein n=1 Tax=Gongylonema pulchrum TaxID=637853 RepID=A0A183DN93_9BILA|nr:unnamed protein product [Gongylonema pulchrum]
MAPRPPSDVIFVDGRLASVEGGREGGRMGGGMAAESSKRPPSSVLGSKRGAPSISTADDTSSCEDRAREREEQEKHAVAGTAPNAAATTSFGLQAAAVTAAATAAQQQQRSSGAAVLLYRHPGKTVHAHAERLAPATRTPAAAQERYKAAAAAAEATGRLGDLVLEMLQKAAHRA